MLAEIEQFVNWVRRRNPEARTWKDYRYDLQQFATLVGDVPPAQVTFREVDRFIDMQQERGFLPTTINRRLSCQYRNEMSGKSRFKMSAFPRAWRPPSFFNIRLELPGPTSGQEMRVARC